MRRKSLTLTAATRPLGDVQAFRRMRIRHDDNLNRSVVARDQSSIRTGAVPAAWGLAVFGQMLFVVGGQLTGVIRLPLYRQLGDVGHHPPLPSRLRWRQQRTLVHCSPRMISGRA